jgi:hypothetical protein
MKKEKTKDIVLLKGKMMTRSGNLFQSLRMIVGELPK